MIELTWILFPKHILTTGPLKQRGNKPQHKQVTSLTYESCTLDENKNKVIYSDRSTNISTQCSFKKKINTFFTKSMSDADEENFHNDPGEDGHLLEIQHYFIQLKYYAGFP